MGGGRGEEKKLSEEELICEGLGEYPLPPSLCRGITEELGEYLHHPPPPSPSSFSSSSSSPFSEYLPL